MPTLEENGKIFTGKGAKSEDLTLKLGNRHGFITGATGIDKTMTLQVPAQGSSRAEVPVFAAHMNDDVSEIAAAGGSQRSSAPERSVSTMSRKNFRSYSAACSRSRGIRSAPPLRARAAPQGLARSISMTVRKA